MPCREVSLRPVSTADPQLAQPARNIPKVDFLGGVLAMLLPGFGHWIRGERRRGRLICAGVLGLFATGVFVGGIDVVDRRESPVWFFAQAGTGPVAFGVDWIHQNGFKGVDRGTGVRRSALPDERVGPGGWIEPGNGTGRPPKVRSVAKVNELGMLFCAVAGMLNLIAVLDALFPSDRGVSPSRSGRREGAGAEPGVERGGGA